MEYPKLLDKIHPNRMARITTEILAISVDKVPDTEWYTGLSMTRLYGEKYENRLLMTPTLYEEIAYFQWLHAYDNLIQVMVNHLAPHSEIKAHMDGPPQSNRFHLPIITNAKVFWWDEKFEISTNMPEGQWAGPVDYCGVMHSMVNYSDGNRIHVVVDFA